MTTVLIGGGWGDLASLYEPFLAAAGVHDPVVACVVLDEGDGAAQFDRWRRVFDGLAPCRPVAVQVPLGSVFDVAALAGADAMFVCGGLTPGYAAALAPAAGAIRAWLAFGRPFVGSSAGAAVAASRAVVGGYLLGSREICPSDAGEDLTQVSVVDGLGLVPFAVDVHAAQWGTLGRLVAAVSAGLVPSGVALDEDTALVSDGSGWAVVGAGAAHVVRANVSGVTVESVVSGGVISF